MENTIGSTRQIEETGNYLQLFIYRAPKKNHDAIAKNLMQFVPWFNKNGVIYYEKKSGMVLLESIDKSLSTAAEDEEEVWIEQQHFRDHKHCEEVFAKMMQDKSIEPLGNEFFGLITQGKKLITGGFIRLRS